MHFNRDMHIRLGVRKLNLLRFEHYKRIAYFSLMYKNLIFKALRCNLSLSLQSRVFVYQRLVCLSKKSRITRHTTRCWFSGRARFVSRKFLLSRMHYRAALSAGCLPFFSVQKY